MIRRRGLLAVALGAPLGTVAQSTVAQDTVAPGAALPLTPACDDDDAPTPQQTAGPFYTPGSPMRGMLRAPGIPGDPLRLIGLVLDQGCRPVAAALVDLWHCDGDGHYDNEGFRCRGHVLTDAAGGFAFDTVRPGLYPGRTRHFHVKVQAPGGPLLTTQLYFAGEPDNARDRLWQKELELAPGPDRATARFDFVVHTA